MTAPRASIVSVLALAAWTLLHAFAPCVCVADDLSDFEAARSLYEQREYARAVSAFRVLVGTEPPRVNDPLLVLESRKYLAASLLFMGAAEDAKTQFKLMLRQEPDYALDPLGFPTEVLALFDGVKADMQRELEAQRRADEAARREADERARKAELVRRENLARLTALAEATEVRESNSRWVASVPFGVGQFQNGDRGLGVALAMSEVLAASTSVVSFIAHQQLINSRPAASDVPDARREEGLWRKLNIVSFGVFAGLALVGILDAHVRFVPERVTSRPRPMPPDLQRWVREQEHASTPARGPRL